MDQQSKRISRPIRRVTVYASSSNALHEAYYNAASSLGEVLGRAGIGIRYGGGGIGLMRAMADAALAHGVHVHGVIPDFLNTVEHGHKRLPQLDVVSSMAERKERMLEGSDAVVALPGGLGTLEELFEVLTLKRLGQFLGPIVLINTRGYYDRCVAFLKYSIEERFMSAEHLRMWSVIEDPKQVLEAFSASPQWSRSAKSFASVR